MKHQTSSKAVHSNTSQNCQRWRRETNLSAKRPRPAWRSDYLLGTVRLRLARSPLRRAARGRSPPWTQSWLALRPPQLTDRHRARRSCLDAPNARRRYPHVSIFRSANLKQKGQKSEKNLSKNSVIDRIRSAGQHCYYHRLHYHHRHHYFIIIFTHRPYTSVLY